MRNGRQTPDVFGFILKRPNGKVRIYGMERNGDEWRAFPVAGDDFLCLNGKEYNALSEMLFCLTIKRSIMSHWMNTSS